MNSKSRALELNEQAPEFFKSLNNENELSCVLLGVNFIDEAMRTILRSKFINSNVAKNILNPTKGFLGNFSSKLDLLYCLGVIKKNAYEDLKILAQIRNVFAHSFPSINFESEKIDGLIDSLNHKEKCIEKPNNFTGMSEEEFDAQHQEYLRTLTNKQIFTEATAVLGCKLLLASLDESSDNTD